MYGMFAAEELGQYIQEQRNLQAKVQASKGLRDHNVSLCSVYNLRGGFPVA